MFRSSAPEQVFRRLLDDLAQMEEKRRQMLWLLANGRHEVFFVPRRRNPARFTPVRQKQSCRELNLRLSLESMDAETELFTPCEMR